MSYNHGQYQHAAVPLPEQQDFQPYPVYDDSFSQKPDSSSSTLVAAQEQASRKRVVRKTCLIATAILISIVGMIFAFLSFICVFHQCQVSHVSVVSTAPLGRVLTISQVTSHVAPLSVPIIMGLFSYFLSARWLRSSADGGPNRPSPVQLGLLMSMCNGAGISSLFSSVKYIAKRPANGQKVAQPPILHQSMIFLGSLLAITYLTAAADSWLHASSTSVIIPSNVPYRSHTVPAFGREINATTCQIASQGNSTGPLKTETCGLIIDAAHGLTFELGEGIRLLHNASTNHRIELTDDQTAIVVPLSLPPNITYSAKTFGVKSQCASITKQCLNPTTLGGSLSYGFDAALNLDCAKAGIKYYVNSSTVPSQCPLNSQGMCMPALNITFNPFTTGQVVTSTAYVDPEPISDKFINNTGWFVHGESGAWNVVFCNVTLLDVTYTYQSSRFIMQSSSPKSPADTFTIMPAGFLANDIPVSVVVEGKGVDFNPTYEDAYSWELSRQSLAGAAYIYGSANVLEIHSQVDVNGSKLQLIPLVLFIGALLVFVCQVLYIALRIGIATWGVQYVELAALQLRDPLATMQRLYGHPDPVLTWETDWDKKFGFETEADRLRLGFVPASNNGAKGSVFVVTKG